MVEVVEADRILAEQIVQRATDVVTREEVTRHPDSPLSTAIAIAYRAKVSGKMAIFDEVKRQLTLEGTGEYERLEFCLALNQKLRGAQLTVEALIEQRERGIIKDFDFGRVSRVTPVGQSIGLGAQRTSDSIAVFVTLPPEDAMVYDRYSNLGNPTKPVYF